MSPLPMEGVARLCHFPVSDASGHRQGSGVRGRCKVLAVQNLTSLTYKHGKTERHDILPTN